MTRPQKIAFLLDVDNTLFDNDHVSADLRRYLTREVGEERARRYWALFETLRSELGYADYLGALQRYRREHPRDGCGSVFCTARSMMPQGRGLKPQDRAVRERLRRHVGG